VIGRMLSRYKQISFIKSLDISILGGTNLKEPPAGLDYGRRDWNFVHGF
jgi:hypothetical protein